MILVYGPTGWFHANNMYITGVKTRTKDYAPNCRVYMLFFITMMRISWCNADNLCCCFHKHSV